MADMTLAINGVVIPKPSQFQRILSGNETDTRTLAGTLYTDFINGVLRSWQISWQTLSATDFNTIYSLYMAQYTNHYYHWLNFPVYGISCPIKMELTTHNIKYNGSYVTDFSMILKEKYAIS